MLSTVISTVAVFSAIAINADALTVRQAAVPTDMKVFCEAITDKATCNTHEFCSYKDDKSECDKLNSWIKAINDAECVGLTEAACGEEPFASLCTYGKNTLRCKGDNDFLYLDEANVAIADGITQPETGAYVHTSAYCRTFTEDTCGQGADATVCEWELAVEASEDEEAKPAQCGNKKKTNEAANLLICAPAGTPLDAAACAADMRCELGLESSEESCKPSDQIIVVV